MRGLTLWRGSLFCETPIICFSGGLGTDGGGWVPTSRLSGDGWDIWASGALTQNHKGFRGTLGIPRENRACGGGAGVVV